MIGPLTQTQTIPGRRRAVHHPGPPYLFYQTFRAVLHADYSYRTTVRHLSDLPDLQFINCDSTTNSARSSSRPRMSIGFCLPVIPNCSD